MTAGREARIGQTRYGTWRVRYSLGYDYAKKDYARFSKTVASETEAHCLKKQIEDYIYHGGQPSKLRAKFGATPSVTFAEYSSKWLKKRIEQGKCGKPGKRLESRTLAENGSHIRRVTALIGHVPMQKLTGEALCRMFFELEMGDGEHKPCRGTYRQHIYGTLNILLTSAVKDDLIEDNPLRSVERPARDSLEKRSMSGEEARRCVAMIVAHSPAAKPFGVLLCLTCGLRPSEMLALTWGDVHLESPTPYIRVWSSAEKDKKKRKATKTNKERDAPIMPAMVAQFRAWAREQESLLEKMGLKRTGATPVVTNRTGGMTIESSFRKWLKTNSAKYGIPAWVRPYNLRHSFVSIGYVVCQIDLKTLGAIVGHAFISTTEGYIHRLDPQVSEAADAMGDFLFSDSRDPICKTCIHWSPSPLPFMGACWAHGMSRIVATEPRSTCNCGLRATRSPARTQTEGGAGSLPNRGDRELRLMGV